MRTMCEGGGEELGEKRDNERGCFKWLKFVLKANGVKCRNGLQMPGKLLLIHLELKLQLIDLLSIEQM